MAEIVKGVLQAKTVSYQWTIKRFFADSEKVGDLYTSPKFPVHYPDKATQWCLQVHPKGNVKKSKGFVSIFLMCKSTNAFEVTVHFKISIAVGQTSQVVLTRQVSHTFTGPIEDWGWARFVQQAAIKNMKQGASTDDTVTILCEITFPPMAQDIVDKCYEYDEWQWINKSFRNTRTYEELFESSSFSDVILNLQGNEIHAHKAILSCHSPVFKAMFEHDMKEKRENSVDITDIDYEVMKELLRFIYSGKVKNIEKIVKELLIAADKYCITDLKALCEKTLYGSLTNDNAVEYLKLANMCCTLRLKKLIFKFVNDNRKDIVKKSQFQLGAC